MDESSWWVSVRIEASKACASRFSSAWAWDKADWSAPSSSVGVRVDTFGFGSMLDFASASNLVDAPMFLI